MKYTITESQYNKAIDKFITYQFEPHEEMISKEYPGYIFWVKDNQTIVRIREFSTEYHGSTLWVNLNIWKTVSSMFSLENEETQEVIKEWFEEHYKMGSLTPYTSKASAMSSPEFGNTLEPINI